MNRMLCLCIGRVGTCMGTMAFAGALPVLSSVWAMDAKTAGGIQTAFNLANALALFVAAYVSDRFGARRVYLVCIWSGAVAIAIFALFATSAASALPLIVLVGLTQGGAYAPAMILAADMSSPSSRGHAMGLVLASGSLGYMLGIVFALWGATVHGAWMGLGICAVGGFLGAAVGHLGLKGEAKASFRAAPKPLVPEGAPAANWRAGLGPASCCLFIGYVAHCWELLGNFAWTPSLLAAALRPLGFGAMTTGLMIGATIHLSGMAATYLIAALSDRWRRTHVLIAVAGAGALCSMLMGMSAQWGPVCTVAIAAVGSFFIFGDSGVLTAAMTEAVPSERLGRIMAVRSIMGFGAGALAPMIFGAVFDATGRWEWAYGVLALGGGIALFAAIALQRLSAGERRRSSALAVGAD